MVRRRPRRGRGLAGALLAAALLGWSPGVSSEGLPFFDRIDEGAGDPAPPPPGRDPFGDALLDVCGAWGSSPPRDAFAGVLLAHPDVLDALRAATGANGDDATLAGRMADLWFAAGGFRHLFCGEPSARGLGGLHYAGRYLQAQERGWATRMPGAACRRQEIAPPVYAIGVLYRVPDGPVRGACVKGYALDLDAAGLLVEATRAVWSARRNGRTGDAVCRQMLNGYQAVVVLRGGAPRTFYPDASIDRRLPRCDAPR